MNHYHAAFYASQGRETASEAIQEDSRGAETRQEETTSTMPDEEKKTVTLRVTGSSGEPFGANYGNLSSARSVEGVAPMDYKVRVRTEPSSGDYIAATAWKTSDNRKELRVQVLVDGRVVEEASTTEDYGAESVRWSPNERTPDESTTKGKTTR